MNLKDYQKFSDNLEGMDRVFTLPDFRILYPEDSEATRFRKLDALVSAGELIRIKNGIYARADADLRSVSQRIAPEAYLSMGTVLAEEGLIGSIPARRVWAVRPGKARNYVSALGVVEHVALSPSLCFGWEIQNGFRRATPEKAWLDAWYVVYKGRRLSFDPVEDVNWTSLDRARWEEMLNKFDPRFQSHVFNLLGEE